MFEVAEVAEGDDADGFAVFDHRDVAKAAVVHQAKGVHHAVVGGEVFGVTGHDGVEVGVGGAFAFGEEAHDVAAGEDAFEVAVCVDHHDGADMVFVHEAAGLLHHGRGGQGDGPSPDYVRHVPMRHARCS